jgi:hypothetical protein
MTRRTSRARDTLALWCGIEKYSVNFEISLLHFRIETGPERDFFLAKADELRPFTVKRK